MTLKTLKHSILLAVMCPMLCCAGSMAQRDDAFVSGTHEGTEAGGYSFDTAGGGVRLLNTGSNLIDNGGFEIWKEECPASWELVTGDGIIPNPVKREKNAPDGNIYMDMLPAGIKGKPGKLTKWYLERYVDLPGPSDGTPMEFSLMMRLPRRNMGKLPLLPIRFLDRDENVIGYKCLILMPVEDWRKFRGILSVPKGTARMRVSLRSPRTEIEGAQGVDDFELRELKFMKKGVYVSNPIDMGGKGLCFRAEWLAYVPEKTALSVSFRFGEPGAWGEWQRSESSPAVFVKCPGSFVQYRAELSSSDSIVSPCLQNMRLDWAEGGAVKGRVMVKGTDTGVPGASVACGNSSDVTTGNGKFALIVSPGTGKIRVDRAGFVPEVSTDVKVAADAVAKVDFELIPETTWTEPRGGRRRTGYSFATGSIVEPAVAWTYDLGPYSAKQAMFADVMGDDKKEMLVNASCRVSAYDCSGKLLWRDNSGMGNEGTRIHGVYDIFGDGRKYVLVVANSGWKLARPYLLDGQTGKLVWHMDSYIEPDAPEHGMRREPWKKFYHDLPVEMVKMRDVNGDGVMDLVCHPDFYKYLRVVDFSEGLDKAAVLYDCDLVHQNLHPRQLIVEDLDGDGVVELVANTGVGSTYMVYSGKTGELIASLRHGIYNASSPIETADIDGDGKSEILTVDRNGDGPIVFDYENKTVSLKWKSKLKTRNKFASGDIDGDGIPEIVVQDGEQVVVLDGEGREKARTEDECVLKDIVAVKEGGKPDVVAAISRKEYRFVLSDGKLVKSGEFDPMDRGTDIDGDGQKELIQIGSDGFVRVVTSGGEEKFKIEAGRFSLLRSPVFDTPLVVDLDSDGKNEVLVQDHTWKYKVLAADNLKQGEVPREAGVLDTRSLLLSFEDINDDGHMETFAGGFKQVVRDKNGQFCLAPYGPLEHLKSARVASGDFNGDGHCDLLVASRDAKEGIYAFSLVDSNVLWRLSTESGSSPFYTGGPAVGDLNGDGADDFANKSGSHAAAWDGKTGKLLWQQTSEEMCVQGAGAIEDLDGDGLPDVLIVSGYAITGWTGAEGRKLFAINSRGQKTRYQAVADVNGDGAWDVGFASHHGKFYCFNGADGEILWIYEIPHRPDFSDPCAADFDGDGRPEFLVGTKDGKLICLNGENGSVCWIHDFKAPVSDAVPGDVDGDGLVEALVVVDGVLVCIDGKQ